MGYEPSSPFLTSIIELKLDQGTMFEWQKHSQASTAVPSHQELLDFLNLRAQASESSAPDKKVKGEIKSTTHSTMRSATSFATSTTEQDSSCVVCKTMKHPLYACPKFKSMPHDKKMSTVKVNELCMNCLKSGHFARGCVSLSIGARSAKASIIPQCISILCLAHLKNPLTHPWYRANQLIQFHRMPPQGINQTLS